MRRHPILIVGLFFLSILRSAIASPDATDIEALINLYGKDTIIHFIVMKRDNQITVLHHGEFMAFNGPPDPAFVTPETIANDFQIIGVSTRDFEEIENRSRLQRDESIAVSADGAKTEDAQRASTNPRLYKATFSPVTLRSSPHFRAPEIGEVPKGAVVEAIDEALDWIKVNVEEKEGWAPVALRAMEVEKDAILICSLYGTRSMKNDQYRSFISVQNVGNKDFNGTLTLYAYNEDQIVFYGFHHFGIEPVPAGGGRTIFIETRERVTRIESVYK